MYRFLSSSFVALLMFSFAAPLLAQSTNVTGIQWPLDPTPAETPFQCADFYDPSSVQIESAVALPSTVPGVTQTFSGTIQNTSDKPLVNSTLFIKIFKEEATDSDSVGNIDTVVEQQTVAENIIVRAGGEVPFSFEWNVPLYAEGGEYYAGFVLVENGRDPYGGLTFSDDRLSESSRFTIVSETQIVKLTKGDVTINDAPYYFRSVSAQLDSREVAVSARLVNPTNQQKILPLQWNQYAWDAATKDNIRNTKTELITLAPNETRTVMYTPTNQREAVVFITATTQERDAKSILNIRYVRQGVEEARLLGARLSSFPLVAGTEVNLFACAHTTGVPTLDATTLNLTVADGAGNTIHQYQTETILRGVPSGFGGTFTVNADYDAVILTAELIRGGVVIDRVVSNYDCNLIDVSSCASEAEGDHWLSFLNKTMVSIIALFLLVGILVFLRLRHRGGHIVAILLLTICTLATPTLTEANSVTWRDTPAGQSIYNFTSTTSFFDQANVDAGFLYSGYFAGITPTVGVTYEADVFNMSNGGTPVVDGASIPVGTALRFVPKNHSGADITLDSRNFGAINGYWNSAITPPAVSCNENDYYSLHTFGGVGTGDSIGGSPGIGMFGSLYMPSSFRIPNKRVEHSGSATLSCDASNQNCTVTGPGSIETRFIFEATNGQLYVRESNYNRSFGQAPAGTDQCRGDNEPVFSTPQALTYDSNMYQSYCFTNPDNPSVLTDYRCSQRNIGSALNVAVPEQQITYTFTVTGEAVAPVVPTSSCTNWGPWQENRHCSVGAPQDELRTYHSIGSLWSEYFILRSAEDRGDDDPNLMQHRAAAMNWALGENPNAQCIHRVVISCNSARAAVDCSGPGNPQDERIYLYTSNPSTFNDGFGNNYGGQGAESQYGVEARVCLDTPPANTAPEPPLIEGPENGVTNVSYDFTFTATDPDGDQLHYGIDWNNDNVVDEWLPNISSYVNSGTTLQADYTWIAPNTFTFKALARDTNGLSSGWATHTITISTAAAETADLKINNSDGPLTVNTGDGLAITWTGSNVPSCALYGAGLPGGTVAVTGGTNIPATLSDTYTLVCGDASDTVVLTVSSPPQPATATLEAQVNGGTWSTADQTIDPGDTVALRWSSTDATSCTGTNFSTGGATSGNGSVTAPAPATATNFGLSCTGSGGNGSDNLVITTRALPNLNQPIITYSLSTGFNPATGIYDSVSVTFQTTNDGGSASTNAASYRVRFDRGSDGYDETKTGGLGTFTVGQNVSRTEVFTNVPFSGNRVEVVVDIPDQVTESNETDNERVLDMTVPPPDPNLEISVDRSPVRRGETVMVMWDTNVTYPMNCSVFGPGVGPINFDPSIAGPTGSTPSQPINAKSEFTLRCVEPLTNTTFTTMAFAETVGEIEEI